MVKNDFYAKGSEWYFCKAFYNLESVSYGDPTTKIELPKMGFLRSILSILLMVIVHGLAAYALVDGVLRTTIQSVVAVLLILAVVNLFRKAYKYLSAYDRAIEENTHYPKEENEEVLLYRINEKGLYFNGFNTKDENMFYFIDWDSVVSIELNKTKKIYLAKSEYSVEKSVLYKIRMAFNKAEDKLGKSLGIEPQLKYDDRYSLYIKPKGLLSNANPIPQTWIEDGTVYQFIESVEHYSQRKVIKGSLD